MRQSLSKSELRRARNENTLKRLGRPEEIAKELVRKSATVIITSRKKSKLQKACNLIGKNSYGFELDVVNTKSIVQFIKRISRNFDTVDVLVNNAGFPFERKNLV